MNVAVLPIPARCARVHPMATEAGRGNGVTFGSAERERWPVDQVRLDEELREVCARHGLVLPDHEHIHGWYAMVLVAGHDPQGCEYTYPVCLTSPGLDRTDVAELTEAKLTMLTAETVAGRPA